MPLCHIISFRHIDTTASYEWYVNTLVINNLHCFQTGYKLHNAMGGSCPGPIGAKLQLHSTLQNCMITVI